ncbi:MAG: ABC transporter ATP-binding protein/permease [Acholeplasmataceae bacterium]|nr:ABC transporter ATP-binding protein/permease [Acholeplasmataceae bacterium]
MKKLYQKIGWFIKKHMFGYAFLIVLLIGIAIFALSPAYVLGQAIDIIITAGLTSRRLIIVVSLLVVLPLTRYLISFLYNHLSQKMAQKLTFELRERYLSHLFDMDSTFYEKFEKGDLIARVTADLDAITQAASGMLEGIVFNVGIILFAMVIMVSTISWELTLISVTILPIGLTLLNRYRYRKRKYFKKHREIYADMTEKILESVEGQKAIRAYVQEDRDLDQQRKAIENDIESWRYIVKFENWFNPMFEAVYGLSYMLAFGFGVFYIFNGEMTLGSLLIFITYIGLMYNPIISISNILAQLNNASIAIERLDDIMSYQTVVHDDIDSQPILSFKTIEFKAVSFKYPFDKKPTIDQISFTIQHGMTIGIVGPTGAGKSTLIRQLLREFNTTSGDILIDGVGINHYKIEDIRSLVGYVPQQHIIFKRSVEDNIMIGLPTANHERFERAIKMADFEKDLSSLQQSIHTMVSEAGASLSGGQKQRLSIARALIKDPEILILDDSLSAVDAKTETTIINHLKDMRQGKTNIIVAHRFSAIQHADLILVLEQGEITQQGTHHALMREDGFYKRQTIDQMTMETLL